MSSLLSATYYLEDPKPASADPLELYMDQKTKQVFAAPGPGRTKMGSFVQVDEQAASAPAAHSSTPPPAVAAGPAQAPSIPGSVEVAAAPVAAKPAAPSWFDKLSLRGYTQIRYTSLFNQDEKGFNHPADRSVGSNETILVRRGRLTLSGDVTDHLFVYLQQDLSASPTDGDYSVQARDIYGDIAIDHDKEYRIRVGQSKVPFGFSNMQSSQNRAAMERPDAINSAVEGERDIGAYFMWAPKDTRKVFRDLVKEGLKGSGDYGVLTVGAYNGQGPNRGDRNDQLHSVARATYPFEIWDKQYFEPSIQAYTGRFVPRSEAFTLGGQEYNPTFDSRGVRDERVAWTAVLYPQPLGFEAEWNIGRTPELSDDQSSIVAKNLSGGYIQANYKLDTDSGLLFPFVRWQSYDGARKFAKNAPHSEVNEWDFGVEYSPWPEVELTTMYTFSNKRTNTTKAPFDNFEDAHRLAFQVQFNY